MNIFDVVIILFILLGAVFGLKRGFTKQLISSLGFLLIIILSFWLKNPISVFFYEHFPFFKFSGIFKGVTALNIALYEVMAFSIIFSILTLIYKLLIFASAIFEKMLSMTILLGIPSKILGAILGMFEHFIWVFIILYILSFPIFNISELDKSKFKNLILNDTPILSNLTSNTIKATDDFMGIKIKYEKDVNAKEFNRETIDIFLKYKLVKIESIDLLIEKNKLDLKKNDPILVKYRNEG